MAKILLVEDDKSLREIYGVRLMAEGYEIVSAGDGEEALAMAIKERPDLIVSDVMMPKISGFDMLDILRSTTETKDVKVIMMTALSSDDQRARGEALGADRYLVKSQVGIEDVVRTVHDVLGDGIGAPAVAAPTAGPPTPAPELATEQPNTAPTEASVTPPVVPVSNEPAPASTPIAPAAPSFNTPGVAPTPLVNTGSLSAPTSNPVYAAAPTEPAMPSAAQVTAPGPVSTPIAPAPAESAATPTAPAPAAAPVTPAAISTTLNELPAAPASVATGPLDPSAITPPVTPVAPPPTPVSTPAPAVSGLPQPTAPFSSPAPASLGERVIEPLTNASVETGQNDIASQMQQALSAEQTPGQTPPPTA